MGGEACNPPFFLEQKRKEGYCDARHKTGISAE